MTQLSLTYPQTVPADSMNKKKKPPKNSILKTGSGFSFSIFHSFVECTLGIPQFLFTLMQMGIETYCVGEAVQLVPKLPKRRLDVCLQSIDCEIDTIYTVINKYLHLLHIYLPTFVYTHIFMHRQAKIHLTKLGDYLKHLKSQPLVL